MQMRLPTGYLDIVGDGAAVLRSLGTALRAEAERRPEAPELWLSVRDLEGLAERLAGTDEWEWEHGFAHLMTNSQDFAVIDELLGAGASAAGHGTRRVTGAQAESLVRLRRFLERYHDRDFERDGPAA